MTRFVLLALILGACTPAIQAPEQRTDVVAACTALRSFHCPEGDGSAAESCEVIVARREALHALPLACWASATNAPTAVLCGSLRCSR